jgi:hypothetical protein
MGHLFHISQKFSIVNLATLVEIISQTITREKTCVTRTENKSNLI